MVNLLDNSCAILESSYDRSLCIDHHVYDKLSDTWVKQRSKSQPIVNVVANVFKVDYAALGFALNSLHTISGVLPAMADTGYQSCLVGFTVWALGNRTLSQST